MTYNELKQNPDIKTYITHADQSLKALGVTEHSFAHVNKVSETAAYILTSLNFDEHDIELVINEQTLM